MWDLAVAIYFLPSHPATPDPTCANEINYDTTLFLVGNGQILEYSDCRYRESEVLLKRLADCCRG